ncbi:MULTISPECIES: hypothetical protein [Streptomyces]|uniref:hypothetical protein n=1 Tax=Streptomyces TaxID=1883 RepID=UPI0002F5C4D1|nr:hypothetical protein [Streptomyces venezuelae]QES02823.1 hypothetical protein DEJ43_34165 [Streptomyces venezuelae ATCC 10712]QES09828.1 hypothetical protein DEJ44_32165 [Streptomyces venezuelae]QES11500.1 hypothetical protein DEJ45_03085 [Streptomyces venezuelae]
MRPESTNGAGGTSGGGLAVPMAWLCAEYLADEVLRAAALVAPGSLEYRAGLQALALTVHLAEEPDGPSGGWAAGRIDEWLRHTAYDRPWPPWVEDRLAARRAAGGDGPDLALAETAWRRLRDTWVRAADLDGRSAGEAGVPVDEDEQIWLPAWKLGLPLAHLSLHLR